MAISQNFPNTRPSLNLNFARSKTLDPRITFSRTNSTATYVDDNGLIVAAGADEPRFDHDFATGESLGLLVEEQRTNLLPYSVVSSTGWSINASTVTANDATAPDGTNTAARIQVHSPGSSNGYVANLNLSVTSGTEYTFSFYVKSQSGSSGTWGINIYDHGGANIGHHRTDVNVTGEWTRVSYSYTPTSGTINVYVSDDRDNTASISDAYVWGAQVEAGGFPTSYIPNTGNSLGRTRTADNVTMTGTNFSDWFNSSEGTIVVDSLVEYDPEATKFVYGISGGSYDLSLRQPHLTGAKFRAVIGGAFSSSPGTGGNAVNGSTTKAAVAYTSSTGRLQVGDSGVDVTPGGAVDGNQLSIGTHNGRIKQLTYYPTRLSNTVLQTLTK